MVLKLTWIPESGATVKTETDFTVDLGVDQPFVFIERKPDRTCLLVANGCIDSQRKTMTGLFGVTEGDAILVPMQHVTLHFGCAQTYRWGGKPAYDPPATWGDWWLRHFPKAAAEQVGIENHLATLGFAFDDTPHTNPDASGSARVFQSAWAGTLAAALGIDLWRVYDAAVAFTDFQLRWRHALFYDASGAILRAHENPWWRVGPTGWDGAIKLKIDSPYKFETTQHLAPDIFFTLAVGWGDYAARLYCDAYIEAVLTRPEFRSSALADDQRSHGYCFRLAALWTLAKMDSLERDEAIVRVVDGLRRAKGFAQGLPYPSRNPPKTGYWSYGWPSLVDWTPYAAANKLVLPSNLAPPTAGGTLDHLRPWLTATAKERKLIATYFTDADTGLWGALRAVSTFQTGGPLLGGLCALRDVPGAAALVPDIALLIRHVTASLMVARMDGIEPGGTTIKANPIHYARSALFPQRVMGWGGGGGLVKNGTCVWMIHSLLEAEASLGPNLKQQALELAKTLYTNTDYPHPPDIQTVGLISLQAFGPK